MEWKVVIVVGTGVFTRGTDDFKTLRVNERLMRFFWNHLNKRNENRNWSDLRLIIGRSIDPAARIKALSGYILLTTADETVFCSSHPPSSK